jgi:hypothetical protein
MSAHVSEHISSRTDREAAHLADIDVQLSKGAMLRGLLFLPRNPKA